VQGDSTFGLRRSRTVNDDAADAFAIFLVRVIQQSRGAGLGDPQVFGIIQEQKLLADFAVKLARSHVAAQGGLELDGWLKECAVFHLRQVPSEGRVDLLRDEVAELHAGGTGHLAVEEIIDALPGHCFRVFAPEGGELAFKRRLAVQTIRGNGFANGNSQGRLAEVLGRPLSPRVCRPTALDAREPRCSSF